MKIIYHITYQKNSILYVNSDLLTALINKYCLIFFSAKVNPNLTNL